jgi:AraC-like DNA-binding protein
MLTDLQNKFFLQLDKPFTGQAIFDQFADIVFFIKNSQGQYVTVNQTLVDRCGVKSTDELVGKTSDEVFPAPWGQEYRKQDEEILLRGQPILNQLELHIYSSLDLDWCLTNKVPMYGSGGAVVGIAGVSRDLHTPNKKGKDYSSLAKVIEHIKKNFAEPLRINDLAKMAGLSPYQFEQRMRTIFCLTAGQFIQKTRIDAAIWKLQKSDETIVNIALSCGYADQSVFSRKFKQVAGLSPGQYRKIVKQEK